jgi:hypothetical protein
MRGAESSITSFAKCLIHEAVTEKLGYRKLCACWVAKILADDHKMKWIGSALKFLTCYAQEGNAFLDSIVTGDETQIFHHTPESKQQSLQWRHRHSPRHSHLAGLWIGAAISNASHSNKAGSTTVNRAQLTGKGSRSMAVLPQQKHKKCPYRPTRYVSFTFRTCLLQLQAVDFCCTLGKNGL